MHNFDNLYYDIFDCILSVKYKINIYDKKGNMDFPYNF